MPPLSNAALMVPSMEGATPGVARYSWIGWVP
jgi:hypothetical protein